MEMVAGEKLGEVQNKGLIILGCVLVIIISILPLVKDPVSLIIFESIFSYFIEFPHQLGFKYDMIISVLFGNH